MKKILSVFLSVAFLSILFAGSAFSEPFLRDDNKPAISDEELNKEESIIDMFDLDEAEAHPLEKGEENPDDEMFDKGDEHPGLHSDDEDEKIQHEDGEKESTIL